MKKVPKAPPLSINDAQKSLGDALKEAVTDAEKPFRSRQSALAARQPQQPN